MTRRICSLATALLIVLGAATTASAQLGPFDIDGTVTDFINSGETTGLTVPPCDPPAQPAGLSPQACKQNDFGGNAQELGPQNGNATKIGVIHSAAVPMLNTTNPNANTDLNAAWIQSAFQNVGGSPHLFLYFGWRRDSNNGSGFISLEIQKAAAGGGTGAACKYDDPAFNPALCNPWAGRQGGDIIFLWDQQGGANTTIIAAPITGTAPNLTVPDCSHSGECIPLNASQAFAIFGTDCGEGFEAGQCGEMVVDLTALGVFDPSNPTRCEAIGNFIPGTVTGNSNTADYKDVVLAPFPRISTCGTVTVTKRTVTPDGNTILIAPLETFGYTLNRISGNIRFVAQPNDGNSLLSITRPNGAGQPGLTTCTSAFALPSDPLFRPCGPVNEHTDLIAAANYRLVESTPPVPWVFVDVQCYAAGNPVAVGTTGTPIQFEVKANTTTSCVITNKLELGNPTALSRQRVIAADQIKIANITAGGASKGAGFMSRTTVRLALFNAAGCAPAAQVASETFILTEGTVTAGKQDLYMSGFSTPTLQRVFETTGTETYYWAFQWDGDTFNNPLSIATTCSSPGEAVSVTITGVQSNIP
ncbi:MAG: hypothetical protein ACRD3G_00770 [Vicinamibacterales bacterium]